MTATKTATENSIALGMLEEFEREYVTTRRFLERLPGARLAWRPHEKSMSAGQLGYHIAETPGRALKGALMNEIAPPDFRIREEAASLGELLTLIDESASCVRETLPTVSDAQMQETFTIRLPDGSSMTPTRERFMRSIMLNHWYHHRGQLGVYLRLLGVSVPSSYGPSGDEPGGM
jgi:uncharacterized damage-inducible protein DinB